MKLTKEQKKHYRFLEELRQSGETNMYAAAPYLAREFGLPKEEARKVLTAWMRDYDKLAKAGVWADVAEAQGGMFDPDFK